MGCDRCGFGFLFELMDDYYPGPNTGLVVCDRDGRVLASGRGVFELTGFSEQEVMGIDVGEALGLEVDGADDPAAPPPHLTAIEWGVRVMDKPMTLEVASGRRIPVTGEFFPAYDSDGGLLAVFTPRNGRS